jgi:hypothetical protein
VPEKFRSNATLQAQWQFLSETYPAFNPPIGTGHLVQEELVSCVLVAPACGAAPACTWASVAVLHIIYGPVSCTRFPDEENEHFIVWMRTAALPNFRKLYGKIEKKVEKGQVLTFTINPCTCPLLSTTLPLRYPCGSLFCMLRPQVCFLFVCTFRGDSLPATADFKVTPFDGKKSLVVSTTSWMGGKNPFLGYAYITVGALCLLLAILFAIKQKISPRCVYIGSLFAGCVAGTTAPSLVSSVSCVCVNVGRWQEPRRHERLGVDKPCSLVETPCFPTPLFLCLFVLLSPPRNLNYFF